MQMKINASTLRQKRKEKFWSQEELAIASGLGLRTIQRVESDGNASFDTIKSIASALEIPARELTNDEGIRTHYYNVQPGFTILGFMFAAFFFCVWQFKNDNIDAEMFITTSVIFSVISSLFGTMSVTASKKELSWYFGVGFWKKRLDLVAIKNVRLVKNKGWWGWGIRHYGDGWLYSVSGLRAVELTLNDGRNLRIGSDEPEQLARFLNDNIT